MAWKRISSLLILIIVLLGCNGEVANNHKEYMVLIGEGPAIVDKVHDVGVLVIDATSFNEEDIATLRSNNVEEIYSYLNIGSIESFRDYYQDFEEYTLGDYENWPDEKWMDVSLFKWIEFVLYESNELVQKGIDGFFIDNADVYENFENDDIYNGIVEILLGIKELEKPVIINGGTTFISKYLLDDNYGTLFKGINQESVYTTYDFINGQCLKNELEHTQYYTEYLDTLLSKGYEVYVIEYAKEATMRKEALTYSQEHHYKCYVSNNIELMLR